MKFPSRLSLNDSRSFAVAVGCLVALAAALRLAGLWSQPLTHDDHWVALSAANYVETGHVGPTMWNHPPLRNLLVHASLVGVGSHAVGLKLWSAALGTSAVLFLALVARRLIGHPVPAIIAGALLAIDPLHIDFSRQAVHEVYSCCFGLMGLWAALRYRDSERWGWLLLAGISFGFGIASKWDVAFVMLVVAGYLTVARWNRTGRGSDVILPALADLAGLGIVAGTIYILTFYPVFARGLDLGEWIGLQFSMLEESLQHGGYTTYAAQEMTTNAAWWFLRPVGYADFSVVDGKPFVLLGITHPLTWLLVWPGAAWLGLLAYRERNWDLGLPVALFAATYLPFVLAQRPIWVHSGFACLSYGLIGVATLVWRKFPKRLLWTYGVLVVLVAIPLYLLATGEGFDSPSLRFFVELYRPAGDQGK